MFTDLFTERRFSTRESHVMIEKPARYEGVHACPRQLCPRDVGMCVQDTAQRSSVTYFEPHQAVSFFERDDTAAVLFHSGLQQV